MSPAEDSTEASSLALVQVEAIVEVIHGHFLCAVDRLD